MRVLKGCGICSGDVFGTAPTGYYCQQCNILFKKRHITFKHARSEVRKLIQEHFGEAPRVLITERRAEIRLPRLRKQQVRDERLDEIVKEVASLADVAKDLKRVAVTPPLEKLVARPKRAKKRPTKKKK